MKKTSSGLNVGLWVAAFAASFLLSSASIFGQGAKKEAVKTEIQLIDSDIEKIKKEIPDLEKRLAESRKAYKERVARLPKNVVLVCGDSTSDSLEELVKLNRERIKNLERMKKIITEDFKAATTSK